MKAIWNDTIIADSGKTIVVENNHYFPPESVHANLLQASETQSRCPWKGLAHYKNIVVGNDVKNDAVWYYPEPTEAAERLGIKNYMAVWPGVEVVE